MISLASWRLVFRNRQRTITYSVTVVLRQHKPSFIAALRRHLEHAYPLHVEHNSQVLSITCFIAALRRLPAARGAPLPGAGKHLHFCYSLQYLGLAGYSKVYRICLNYSGVIFTHVLLFIIVGSGWLFQTKVLGIPWNLFYTNKSVVLSNVIFR